MFCFHSFSDLHISTFTDKAASVVHGIEMRRAAACRLLEAHCSTRSYTSHTAVIQEGQEPVASRQLVARSMLAPVTALV